jgi:RNA polymerase sigma-70 factor, ECF subfamily
LNLEKISSKEDEIRIVDFINRDNEDAFQVLVRHYTKRLYYYAWQYLGDRHMAEDIVQDLFAEIWTKRKSWHPNETLQGYLLKSIKNRCLRYIQKQRPISSSSIKTPARAEFEDVIATTVDIHSAARIENSLMEKDILDALQSLPERCGLIFRMHRFEGISQKEIAKELNISVKTVGNQIQRAVTILYKKLKHHIDSE